MTQYNYREHITSDIIDYINDNINLADYDSREDLAEYLGEELWTADSVTGNASGSYTFDRWEAEENLCHNLDLLQEACAEFGSYAGDLLLEPETADVTIRCYLLGECIDSAIGDVWED